MRLPESRPASEYPSWRRVRDAALKVLVDGAEGDRGSLERLSRRLAELDGETAARLTPHLFDTGHEIGRHVHAKRVTEDSFQMALETVREGLASTGWAELAVEDMFHRTARLTWNAGHVGLASRVRDTIVLGVLEGTVTEALNISAVLTPDGDGLRVELSSGDAMNEEEEP